MDDPSLEGYSHAGDIRGGGVIGHCRRANDLSQSERRFLAAIQELWFGRFESLSIERGQLLLNPWPRTVRYMKLGSKSAVSRRVFNDEFELECPVIELFEYVRSI